MLLQDERIEINKQNEYGTTALIEASDQGHKEIVEILLQDKRIEINKQNEYGTTSLIEASDQGHKEIVEMLLQDKIIRKTITLITKIAFTQFYLISIGLGSNFTLLSIIIVLPKFNLNECTKANLRKRTKMVSSEACTERVRKIFFCKKRWIKQCIVGKIE